MTWEKLVSILFVLLTITKVKGAAHAFSITLFIRFCFRTEKQLLCIVTLTPHSKIVAH